MPDTYYYYLDNNVFSGLQSKPHYDKFFKDLKQIEIALNINKEERRYISTPYSIIEYLGIEIAQRPKPNPDVLNDFIKNMPPAKSFNEFCKFSSLFFSSEIQNYYELLLERNRQKVKPMTEEERRYAVKPHFQELWNLLITQEIQKEDFLAKLSNSLWWDYVTDWVNKMPEKVSKENISQITTDLLNVGIKMVYEDSINLLRLVKTFHSLVNMKQVESLSNSKKEIIVKRRASLLKRKAFKPAAEDLADSDIIQYSVTGYKDSQSNIFPVVTFTTDSATTTGNRINLLKDILSVYYNKTIKESDRILIEGFNQGMIFCLSKYSKHTTFEFVERVDAEELNETWLTSEKQ